MTLLPPLNNKLFSVLIVIALLLPFVGATSYNVIKDPFEIFHRDKTEPAAFLGGRGKDRYQHAGVVLQYQPKSIIIGHSHAANFLPSRVDRILGLQDTYSLTLDAGSIFEQNKIARFALKNSEIRDVMWLFATYYFHQKADFTNRKIPFPHFLYDENRLNDISLFDTLPMTKQVEEKSRLRNKLRRLARQSPTHIDPRDYSTAWHWNVAKTKYNRPVAITQHILGKQPVTRKIIANLHQEQSFTRKYIEDLAVQVPHYESNLRQNILPLIQSYPNITFRIIVDPPFPLLYWQRKKTSNRNRYDQHIVLLKRFVHDLAQFPNVKIYGFGGERLTSDLRLYRDKRHYHMSVNDYMLESMSMGRNHLTPENIIDYLVRFDERVSHYSLQPEWDPDISSDPTLLKGLSEEEARTIIIKR